MSDALKAGDLCVVINPNNVPLSEFEGAQPGDIVELVRRYNGLGHVWWIHKPGIHNINAPNPSALETVLRKIGDDRKVVRWDQCFWKPREVVDV